MIALKKSNKYPEKKLGIFRIIMSISATNILVMIINTLASVITARMFGVAGKGEFSAILFWPTLLSGLIGFGLPSSLIYNIKKYKRKLEFTRSAICLLIIVSVVVGIISWTCLPYWLSNYSTGIIQSAQWYTVCILPTLVLLTLLAAIAQSIDNYRVYNKLRISAPLFNSLGLIFIWILGYDEIDVAILVYAITTYTVMLWFVFELREVFNFNWLQRNIDWLSVKRLFVYGIGNYGTELISTIYSQFDKLVIMALLSPKDLGLYTVVYAMSRIFSVMQTAISNVLFPKMTGLSTDRVLVTIFKSFRLSTMIMLLLLFPSLLIGKYLLSILFGKPFLAALDSFYLLSIEGVLVGGSMVLSTSFKSLGRPSLALIRQIISLVVTVTLFFILTPYFGLIGISWSVLIVGIVQLVVTIMTIRTLFKVSINSILFDKDDFLLVVNFINKLKKVV